MKRILFILRLPLPLALIQPAFAQNADPTAAARKRFLARDILIPAEPGGGWLRLNAVPEKKEDGSRSPQVSLKMALLLSFDQWMKSKSRALASERLHLHTIGGIMNHYNRLLPSNEESLTVEQALQLSGAKLSAEITAELVAKTQKTIEDRCSARNRRSSERKVATNRIPTAF